METESSLPCSQEPATGSYLQSDASNPHLPPYFPKIHCNIIISSMSRFLEWSLPFRFSNQTSICISHLFHVCYMYRHPILFDLFTVITSDEEYNLNIQNTVPKNVSNKSWRPAWEECFKLCNKVLYDEPVEHNWWSFIWASY